MKALLPSFDAPVEAPFSWLAEMAGAIRGHMLVRGAVFIRGLPMHASADLAKAREALGITIHVPTEAFTYRRDFGNGIYSPIRWPDERLLCPFQECAFSSEYPSVVLTACVMPPGNGGQAHLSDTRRVMAHLPVHLTDRIRAGGWSMTRVFHDGFGISWREAYSVTDRAELDEIFASEGIEYRWLPSGALHTLRHRPGMINHPVTGEECWFNQIAFLNAGSMEPRERALLIKAFGADLPVDSAFGDGAPVSQEDLTAMQGAIDRVKCAVEWRPGDLLIADNIIMAQGRAPFEGAAEFLVALGDDFDPGTAKPN